MVWLKQESPRRLFVVREDLDKFLAGGTLPECQVHFHQCSHDLSEWVKWGNENYPIGQQLYAENVRLAADNKSLRDDLDSNRVRVFLGFAGVGAGFGVVVVSVRLLRRKWRASPLGKQLTVLVLGAVWVSVVALVSGNIPSLVRASGESRVYGCRLFDSGASVQRDRILVVCKGEARVTLGGVLYARYRFGKKYAPAVWEVCAEMAEPSPRDACRWRGAPKILEGKCRPRQI